LVTQFQGYKGDAERLAGQIDSQSVLPTHVLGISVHVDYERTHAGPKLSELYGPTPFINSAEALAGSFNELGYAIYRADRIGFMREDLGRLGRETIADAADETARHFNAEASEVGQIAVVSAMGLGEADLDYSDFGSAYLLQEVDENGKFSWATISEGRRKHKQNK
jgi:hypothetical protein